MNPNLKADYLNYMKEVLGISRLFPDKSAFEKVLKNAEETLFYSNQIFKFGQYEVAFVNIMTCHEQSLFDPPANELFEKMRASVKWTSVNSYGMDSLIEDFQENIVQLRQREYDFSKVLFFVSEERYLSFEDVKLLPEFNLSWAVSPSPFLILQKPELKRRSWELLKALRT